MIDYVFQENFHSRKLLQTNSSSSFDASQPTFIALLCVIGVLTIALVITISILCYRYYSHREPKAKLRPKRHRVLSIEHHQPTTIPASITPTSVSSFSGRSSAQLLTDQRPQNVSINTLPSRRFDQSLVDAYINDLPSFQPASLDPKQLNSYLFIDLHSTSSETCPENISRQVMNNTNTSGYNTSTEDESQRKQRFYVKSQHRYRTKFKGKQGHHPRFIMRERTLPSDLQALPQLRQLTTQKGRNLFGLNGTNNSSATIIHPDLQSTTMSTTTTDEYDESHAYNVKQNQMLQTIKESKAFFTQPHFPDTSYDHEPYLFEVVSTSHDDSSDLPLPYMSYPMIGNRLSYMNDSIIV